ncbi:Condensin-2 complex subunit H2 [Strongyloides ratti]|uniref:Condensin-2 complex subunit H2 n=1 Tax=Strongyloides ratti TaxID=34506 RepID=A0A090L5U9_STRRB|nr:Condensin-2 complex subunit H2 [Strongyloides ratti]CEF65156.1 Condensin-2 complex subunit H2 [Strongyloides ratti]
MDSNAEQLFRKLLEPITAIGDLFQVNLSTILDPFLEHLEDVLCKVKDGENQEKEIDFVRAGYLITNATLLYSAKVDSLYKEVHDFIDKLRSGDINEEENDGEIDPEKDLEMRLSNNKNPFVLLPISGLKKGPKSSRFNEFDPQPCDIFAKTQVSFMSMSETEKRRVNLFSTHNKSIVIGSKDDFLLNTCSFLDNGTAILDYEFLDIINVVIPPRNIVTIDELPPTLPEEGEAMSSRRQCYNPNQLEDQLVRNLEKQFCSEYETGEVMVDYTNHDEGMEFDDGCINDLGTNPSTRLVENMRESSCQPSRMGNYDISEVLQSSQHNVNREVLCEIQNDTSIVARNDCKPTRCTAKLEKIVEQIKDQIGTESPDDIDNIKCRSFRDAFVEDNFLNEEEGRRSIRVMIPVNPQKKFLNYDKILKERDRKIKRALEKQDKLRKTLSFSEIKEYFRINNKGKFSATSGDVPIFDENKLYAVSLNEDRGKIRLLRRKIIKECKRNINAATNIPETVVECMNEPEVDDYFVNNPINSDDRNNDNENDDCIPTIYDNGVETLPIVDEHLLTQDDFDLIRVPEIDAINNAMNASRKRDLQDYEQDLESGRRDQMNSQTEGSTQNKGERPKILEAYLNDSIMIQADEELPLLTYTEIIEKYNDKYWKNIDHEVGKSYEKVIEWDDFLKPHIKVEEERKHFDITEYGHSLINKFGNVGEIISFADMVKTCSRYMISRFFLSSLLLVNKGNFKTNNGGDINSISFELVKTDFDASEE